MFDLYIAMGLSVVAGAGLGVLVCRLSKGVPQRWLLTAAVVCVGLMFANGRLIRDRLWVAALLPTSALPVAGNLFPLLAGILGGIAWRLIPGRAWRKCISIVPLAAVCLYVSYGWIFGPLPETSDAWADGVCIQTTEKSCSAAAAATLFAHYGIQTNETEMARLCLTREIGTTMWGLYRGVRLKAADTPYRVAIMHGEIESLASLDGEPALLVVGIEKGADIDPRYEQEWQWRPGVRHAVVFFGFAEDDLVEIGDPSVGREFWRRKGVDDLWHRVAIRLVKRANRQGPMDQS